MPFSSGPWNGSTFEEDDWRQLFSYESDRWIGGSITRSASNREITISSFVAFLQGVLAVQTSSDVVDVPVPTGSNKRIDYLVLRYDPTQVDLDDRVQVALVQGSQAISPLPPSLEQDPDGIWEHPLMRIGPYGSGAIASAPAVDCRNRKGRIYVQNSLGIVQATVLNPSDGDLAFVISRDAPDGRQIYWYNSTSSAWESMFPEPPSPQLFTTSSSGYPKAITKSGGSGSTEISNRLVIPSASYRRAITIDCMHYLHIEPSSQWDCGLFLNSSTPVKRARHTRIPDEIARGSVALSAGYILPANQSLEIRLGFWREGAAGVPAGEAISSGSPAYNSITALAVPISSGTLVEGAETG